MSDIDWVLDRGVEAIIPSRKQLKTLLESKKIKLYQGFDPSRPSLHLGNLIGIRKLAQFQKLGHKVIFLIGDFTGTVGDPTDKASARKKLSHRQVLENSKGFKDQIKRVLDFEGKNKAEIKYNSKWLSELNLEEIIDLAANFTAQQMLERDFFQERLKKKRPIYLSEFLYPLLQAYDCVAMEVDLEIGGNDQLFNILAGRNLLKTLKNKEKFVLTLKLLEDPGGKKMGKTEGNTVNLDDTSENMYAKILALPDHLLEPAVELLTDFPLDLLEKEKPLELKKKLAFDVIRQVKGDEKAKQAEKHFEKTFQERDPEFKRQVENKGNLLSTIAQVTKSKSQAKRLLAQGAVDVNQQTIKDPGQKIKGGDKIKVGQKTFIKVK